MGHVAAVSVRFAFVLGQFVLSSSAVTLWFMAEKRPTLTERYKQLSETLEAVEGDRERLSESLSNAVMMLRQEDVGWATPGTTADAHGLSLGDLRKWSDEIRVSLTGTRDRAPNPHMRNGLMLRHSYIWDGGMHYADIPEPKQGRSNVSKYLSSLNNKRKMFSQTARARRERALFSDGLYLAVGNDKTYELRPVPLSEISDTHRDELYEDEIVAYRWTRNEYDGVSGSRVEKSHWVFVDWYDGKRPATILYQGTKEMVMKGHTAFDLHANRPDGAAFGSPDAIAAIVWARIIRDLIMNGVKMQDALAMFAFKATSGQRAGQQAAALELSRPQEAGSSAVLGGDNNLVPLSSAGRGYDFGSIGFIVSTMAASLHVSGIALSANTSLAGSSYGAAKTLDLPGRMAMQTRRAEHVEFDERILRWLGAPGATAYFDNYDDSTDEYRSVQAAMLAWNTGTLSPEGFRAELETIYGRKMLGSIPDGVMVPNNMHNADNAPTSAAAGVQAAAPDQGRSNGTGGSGHANDIAVDSTPY